MSKSVLQLSNTGIEVNILQIELVDHKCDGNMLCFAQTPETRGLHFDASPGVDDQEVQCLRL